MEIQLLNVFKDNIENIVQNIGKVKLQLLDEFYKDERDIISYGVTSIISFAGKRKGRLLLDMEPQLAIYIAKNITKQDYTSVREDLVLASISELNNIISGGAITKLNNELALKLRLAPPLVFTGENPLIAIPKLSSMSGDYTSEYGNLKVNVAFEEGE